MAGKSGGKEGRSRTQTSLGIPRYDCPFHIRNDLFIKHLQPPSSFQYLCSGLRGPANLPSTCTFPWVPWSDSRYRDISVCCHPYTAARHPFNCFVVFLSVSDFTVESYGLMASSAVTGQSFARGAPYLSLRTPKSLLMVTRKYLWHSLPGERPVLRKR